MNLYDHRIATLKAKIKIHENSIRQRNALRTPQTENIPDLDAIQQLNLEIVEQLNQKLHASAKPAEAERLAAELRTAKAAHTAHKCFVQMPHPTQVSTAQTYITKHGVNLIDSDARRQYQVVKDRDAVLAYRKEKARLADNITTIQRLILEATQPSDLE